MSSRRRFGSVLTILRALGYALTSLFAGSAGYLLQAEPREWSGALLVLAVWTSSLTFFLSYAIVFDYGSEDSETDAEVSRVANRDAGCLLPLMSAVFIALFVSLYKIQTASWPAPSFALALGFVGASGFAYGRFLSKEAERGERLVARHQLVWPVLYSIALPLYLGAIYSSKTSLAEFFVPLVVVLVSFFVTQTMRPVYFSLLGVVPLSILVLLQSLDLLPLWGSVSSLALYVAAAAYLAVFESWRLCSYLAINEVEAGGRVFANEGSGSSILPASRARNHYLATLLVLGLAGLLLPLQYVFSNYGRVFMYGIGFHVPLAFALWYWAGGGDRRLASPYWEWVKTVVGSVFLSVIVADSFFKAEPSERWLPDLVDVSTLALFFGPALTVAGIRIKQSLSKRREEFLEDLGERRQFLWLVVIAVSFLASFAVLGIQSLRGDEPSVVLYKCDRVFSFYMLMLFLATVMLIGRSGVRTVVDLAARAGSVFALIRAFTVMNIGMVVLVPALFRAELSLIAGAMQALPFCLAAAGAFALNDARDIGRDLIDKPFRVLPSGKLTPRLAEGLGRSLLLVAAIAVLVNHRLPLALLALQMFAVAGAASYNWVVRHAGPLKWVLTALVCCSPLVFSSVAFGLAVPPLVFVCSALLFLLGRELVMDVRDMSGDSATGLYTFPMVVGRTAAGVVARVFWVASALLIAASVPQSEASGRLVVASVLILALAACWHAIPRRLCEAALRLSWVPMLLALSAAF